MGKLSKQVAKFSRNESGGTAVEYGLLMALMALAMIGALAATGSSTEEKWDGVADEVAGAMQGAGN
ncbi:MAG: Flp family type IVb pilin [Pseudomonadota bacterium]